MSAADHPAGRDQRCDPTGDGKPWGIPAGRRCEAVHPASGRRCIEPAGHQCSHGDGSVIRWLTADQRTVR